MFPSKQKSIKSLFSTEDVKKVGNTISKFFLFNTIPFNAADSGPYYKSMVDTIAEAGPGIKGPMDTKLEIHIWKRRCKSLRSMIYHSSVDTTNIPKTTDYIFSLMDKVVEEVGEKNVVQVVIDNDVKLFVDGRREFGSDYKESNKSISSRETVDEDDGTINRKVNRRTSNATQERDVDSHRKGKAPRKISSSSSSDDNDNGGSRRGSGTSGGSRGVGGTGEDFGTFHLELGKQLSDAYFPNRSSPRLAIQWLVGDN
ncbi:hypothetical protein CK203_087540 [Vitis vinifera]|uniref:DUF659 domain-containing protein n=1 Tax=Vitis vinifera TaxID=29760 RepID=A0A438DA96_VITVI|nr:hypothetical protein CK203_087540 [Vitis vinifera]